MDLILPVIFVPVAIISGVILGRIASGVLDSMAAR